MANARYKNVNDQKATLIVELTRQEVAYGEEVEIDEEIGKRLNPAHWELVAKPKKSEESK